MSVNSRSWTEVELRRSSEVEPLLEQVVAAMVAQDYSRRTCWEMRLALEEAIINGLRHGNRFDPTKRVLARFHVGPSSVLAEVEDGGLASIRPTCPTRPTRSTWRGPAAAACCSCTTI